MGDKGVSDQEFCLLSEFITNEIILDKENLYTDKLNSLLPGTHGHVPTESPTESLSYFSNNFLVPPFSAGPKILETQKAWPAASLTQSVLSPVVGTGSSLVPSPPITPIGQNADYHQGKNMTNQGQNRNFTSINPTNALPSVHNGTVWGGEQAGNGGYDATPGVAWGGPHVHYQRRSYGGFDVLTVGYGSGMKNERAGTGVFLPRSDQNTTPGTRKKTGGSPTQPPKRVVQAQNKKFENVTSQLQSQRQQFIGSSHISENELAMVRRDGALAQERRKYEMMTTATSNPVATSAEEVDDEIRLPQEWTY